MADIRECDDDNARNTLGAVSATEGAAVSCSVPASTASHAAPTKGSWHVDRIAAGPSFYVIGNDGEDIARVRGGELQSHPNAHLIAAAPELLRELKHLVSLMEPVEHSVSIPGLATLNGARAAIAKAEGR